jgi:hypothetical protein
MPVLYLKTDHSLSLTSVPDVSKRRSAFIFKVAEVLEESRLGRLNEFYRESVTGSCLAGRMEVNAKQDRYRNL